MQTSCVTTGLFHVLNRSQWRKEEKAGVPHPPLGGSGSYNNNAAAPLASLLPGGALSAPTLTGGSANATCPGGAPAIKGNINSKGAKIYHMPGESCCGCLRGWR